MPCLVFSENTIRGVPGSLLAVVDKSGADQKRVYKKLISLADIRYDRYLLDLIEEKKEELTNGQKS